MLPRGWLLDTATLYARVFRRGARLALTNWPVGLMVVAYGALLGLVTRLVAPLGIIGGFVLWFVMMACLSSWLSLVEQVIRSGRVRLGDVPSSFAAYLGELLAVGFLTSVLWMVASIVLAPFRFLAIVFGLAVLVFFNAVPELVYLGRHSAAELLVESYRFIGENWIEWFPATLALGAAVIVVAALPGGPFDILGDAAAGVLLYFMMIVRGLLFLELAASRAPRKSRVPPKLHACAEAAGSPQGAPLSRLDVERIRRRTPVDVLSPLAGECGSGGVRGATRSSRASAQLRGDATFTSRAWSEDPERSGRPRFRTATPRSSGQPCSDSRKRSASIAAMHPVPAAVTACR
ncbi:MAG: hypothetical protein E6J56_14105 [Deltaproteobacteria bacterium]|nr:MAG: hypothetical protein E6J56_14105 [Deltaproteobacteria bacterium]